MGQPVKKEVPRNTSQAVLATSSFVPPTNVPNAEITRRRTRRKTWELCARGYFHRLINPGARPSSGARTFACPTAWNIRAPQELHLLLRPRMGALLSVT